MQEVSIALLGNPNAGKTTLFNRLTGSRQKTGNWPGVTVDRKEGYFSHKDTRYQVVDLPGTYSLDRQQSSVDELIAREYIQQHRDDVYINVLDANTLERGLYLTTQLREQGVATVVLLTMMDIVEKHDIQINIQRLSEHLDCPVIPINLHAKSTESNDALKTLYTAIQAQHQQRHQKQSSALHIPYPNVLEKTLSNLQTTHNISREKTLLALEEKSSHEADVIRQQRQQIEKDSGESLAFLLADGRFSFARDLANNVVQQGGKVSRSRSDKIDRIVLGRWTGIPIFLVMIYLMFLFSINFGGAFIDFFDLGAQAVFVDGFGHLLAQLGSPEWLMTVLAKGVGGGIQVVATFIPVIAALYLFLTLLEESGYMARAAFVMDRFMRRLGLSGKAFVPLIVGFGCNVPAIMAARTLDTHRERILTVMMAPFMSCGARLTVYALFAAAFFPIGGQNIVFLLYLIGIAFAIFTALLLRHTLLKGKAESFLMELPTYQIPRLQNIWTNTWNKLKGFVLGAGKIIIVVVMIINIANSLGTDGSFGNEDSENSVLSATAKSITPVFEPMGITEDNWPATVGILTGILAKEVVVGTLDALYSQIDQPQADQTTDAETDFQLGDSLMVALATIPANVGDALRNLADPLGLGILNDTKDQDTAATTLDANTATFGAMQARFEGQWGAFAYLLFVLLYFPCVAATGAIFREVGARWATLAVLWSTGLAYISAVTFYQLGQVQQQPIQALSWSGAMLGTLLLVIFVFYYWGKQQTPPVRRF